MEINFHVNVASVGRTPPSKPVNREAQAASEEVALENSRALRRALEETPAVRTDLVQRAHQMVGDVNYPPPETIQQIAHLLAMRLSPDGS